LLSLGRQKVSFEKKVKIFFDETDFAGRDWTNRCQAGIRDRSL